MSARRARGGFYPLWIGMGALAVLAALWVSRDPSPSARQDADAGPPSAPASQADADAPAGADPDAPRAELVWRLTDAKARAGSEIGGCLRAAGWDRVTAHGGGEYPVSVTYSPLILPSIVTPDDGGLVVRTPMAARRHQAFALHTAIVGCLPGATIVDADLGTLATAATWPSPDRAAGMRAELVVRVESAGAALQARGLGRLGLMDLVLEAADTPTSRRRLLQAAALLLVQDDPDLTTMRFGDGQATLTPASVDGLVRAHQITLPEGATAVAPPSIAPPTAAPETRTRRRAPKPRPPRQRAPAKRPTQPPPAAPKSRWRPDYF